MPLGDKRLKSKMREMDTRERLSSGTSATSLPARSYGVTSVPTSARASLPAPSMEVELPSTFSRDIESVRRMTSTSRPRKSASAELARTTAPARSSAPSSRTPRGPQVSMPMRSPSRMGSISDVSFMPEKNLGVRRSAAPIVISAPAPSRSSTPARQARPSTPARPASTAKPAPRRQAPSVTGVSSSTRKKQDEQMSTMRARVEQGRNTDFAKLGASFYSGLSRR